MKDDRFHKLVLSKSRPLLEGRGRKEVMKKDSKKIGTLSAEVGSEPSNKLG